jgi:hypothetical protein
MNQSDNLLDALVSADNGGVIRRIAGSLGVSEDTVVTAARSMLPALARGLENETAQPESAASLAQALEMGDHQRYLQDPALIDQPAGIEDGNAILGHILGSKDVSRNVAGFASEKTGIDPDLLKKMLPMLATAVMALLAARTARGSQGINPGGPGGGSLLDMVGGFLDVNKDGSPVDDLLNLAQRYFRR